MSQELIACPNCQYEANAHQFEVLVGNRLKCRRCRGDFTDPDAFKRDFSYADCDNDRAVSKYPFALSGSIIIRVRDGYIACASSSDGQTMLYTTGTHIISDAMRGLQLFYINLNPRLLWGSLGKGAFGVYGSARLSLSEEYIRRGISEDQNFVHSLENKLTALLLEHLNNFITGETRRSATGALLSPNGYVAAHGIITDGVRLVSVNPRGFRQGAMRSDIMGSSDDTCVFEMPRENDTIFNTPITIEKLPTREYTVARGTEEVFVFDEVFVLDSKKRERHKSGEIINPEALKNVHNLIRYKKKEFDFPYGWGIYNQSCDLTCEYCANGTISFYVDSTEIFSELISNAGSFEKFAEFFFANVLKKELSEHLKPLLNRYISKQDFDISNINSVLSALSLKLYEALNGDDDERHAGAFKRYGLRTSKLDILHIGFNS